MTIPTNVVAVNGQGVISDDQANTYTQTGGVVANLQAFNNARSNMSVELLGYSAPGDGGQGLFYYNPSSTAADDGGVTTVQPNGVVTGRWLRLPTVNSIGVIGIQAFTTSGTYTPTSGMKTATVQAWGGGGSGASTVAGGTGGGQTSLGSLVIANGGSAGSTGGGGGAGGTGGTGSVGIAGPAGGTGAASVTPATPAFSPTYGAGGAGDGTGGGGGAAEFRMSYVTAASIGASQVVTIGAAGTGGNANGSNGYMLIVEYG